MSGPGSPSGSPVGATGAGQAEQVFAQLLLQLQQGQAQIARETREGLQKLADGFQKSATRPGIVDVKGIGKPDILKGSHEEVQKQWKPWSYKFETWFCSQWPTDQQALDYARGKGDDPVSAVDLLNGTLQDVDAIDARLHVALVSLTQGMAYDVVYNSRKKCGLDAWRRLCVTYEPQNNRTNIRLLRRILSPARATMSTMRSSLDRFESDIVEYESRGQTKPSDETLRAVLLAMVPENLEEHLELNIQRFDTYPKMRSEVISFLEQKASKSMVDDGGAAPMDLDYVQGKGKGKSTKTCYTCGKVGHVSKDCWHGKSKGTSSSSTSKGSSSKGSSTGKGTKGSKGSPKGKGKSSKGKGKSKMGSKSGKQYAVESQEETQQWTEEPEAEGQETWNEEAWPNQDGQWDEQTGEQGAICVASADSAQQAPRQRPLTKYEKALEGEQKEFMEGKIWKRPEVFWNMPFRLVCNQSCYEGKFYCGYQRCKHKGFTSPSQFNQHLRSKVGTHGHPDQEQIDAWEKDPYEVPKGRRHYGLWDPVTGNMLNAKVDAWDSEPLRVAIEKSKERLRLELSAKKPPAQEEATEVEKKETVLLKAKPKCKPEKFGTKHVENVDDSSEYTIDSEDIEEGEPEAFEVKDEKVKIPEEDPEEKPEETAEDLEALR